MKLFIHSPTSTAQSFKFGNRFDISSHTLLNMLSIMWLIIHAGLSKKEPLGDTATSPCVSFKPTKSANETRAVTACLPALVVTKAGYVENVGQQDIVTIFYHLNIRSQHFFIATPNASDYNMSRMKQLGQNSVGIGLTCPWASPDSPQLPENLRKFKMCLKLGM